MFNKEIKTFLLDRLKDVVIYVIDYSVHNANHPKVKGLDTQKLFQNIFNFSKT